MSAAPAAAPLPTLRADQKETFQVPIDLNGGILHTCPNRFIELTESKFRTMSAQDRHNPEIVLQYIAFVESTNDVCVPQSPLTIVGIQPTSVGDGRFVRYNEWQAYVDAQRKIPRLECEEKTNPPPSYLVAVIDARGVLYWMTIEEVSRCLGLVYDGAMSHEEAATMLPFGDYVLEKINKRFLIRLNVSNDWQEAIQQTRDKTQAFLDKCRRSIDSSLSSSSSSSSSCSSSSITSLVGKELSNESK